MITGGSTSQRVELRVDVSKLPKPCQKNNQEDSLNLEYKNSKLLDNNLTSSSYYHGQREITPKEGDDRQTDTIQSLQKQELDKYNSMAKNNGNESVKQVKLYELMKKPDETNA